ncbi:hypothetical protein [Solirubrobacter soli]|uniref:hypothetical protein n=1 Tax=Solirubrobacter soli TaxID=363832 RepID=UPI00040E7E5C|nr:hypothetical protein [Solirubrobacter soli]
MTTLLAEGEALIVRCDECRRLWPVTRGRVESHWQYDEEADLHLCPVCADERSRDPAA